MIDDDVKKKLAGNSIDRKFTQECANMAISLFLQEKKDLTVCSKVEKASLISKKRTKK